MATYVLVHGAWQGASTWNPTVERLQRAGHRVFIPTLTGLGEKGHQLSPELNLEHHVRDVVGLFEFERLQDVVLVGHSYGGTVITAAAERLLARISRLVYADAFVPDHGESTLELMPAKFREAFQEQARTMGEGWRLPGFEKRLDLWGLKPGPDWEFVASKLCDFSLRFFESKVHAPTGAAALRPRLYVAAVAEDYPARPGFARFAARAKREGWQYVELPTGHDCHVEAADAFARILCDLA